jgi:hypothetical protein
MCCGPHSEQQGDDRQSFAAALSRPFEHLGPRFRWDHVSHKDFAPSLNARSKVETNASKNKD